MRMAPRALLPSEPTTLNLASLPSTKAPFRYVIVAYYCTSPLSRDLFNKDHIIMSSASFFLFYKILMICLFVCFVLFLFWACGAVYDTSANSLHPNAIQTGFGDSQLEHGELRQHQAFLHPNRARSRHSAVGARGDPQGKPTWEHLRIAHSWSYGLLLRPHPTLCHHLLHLHSLNLKALVKLLWPGSWQLNYQISQLQNRPKTKLVRQNSNLSLYTILQKPLSISVSLSHSLSLCVSFSPCVLFFFWQCSNLGNLVILSFKPPNFRLAAALWRGFDGFFGRGRGGAVLESCNLGKLAIIFFRKPNFLLIWWMGCCCFVRGYWILMMGGDFLSPSNFSTFGLGLAILCLVTPN